MLDFKKILFPIDMSDSCTTTAPFVEAMARKYSAEITMLHVLEMPSALIADWSGGGSSIHRYQLPSGRPKLRRRKRI